MMVLFMKATLRLTYFKVADACSKRMGTGSTAFLARAKHTAWARISQHLARDTKVNGAMTSKMAMGRPIGPMDLHIQVNT